MRISDWSSDVCSSDLSPRPSRKSSRRWTAGSRFGISASVGIVVERLFEIRKHTDRQLDWCSVWQFGKLELSHVSGSPVREYQILTHHQPHRRAGPDRNSRLDAKVMLGDLAPARATLSCVDIRIACTRSLWPDRASSELTPSSVESAAPFKSCQVWKSTMTSTFRPRRRRMSSARW